MGCFYNGQHRNTTEYGSLFKGDIAIVKSVTSNSARIKLWCITIYASHNNDTLNVPASGEQAYSCQMANNKVGEKKSDHRDVKVQDRKKTLRTPWPPHSNALATAS